MDKLIKELKKEPFSGKDIYDICENKTKVIIYSELYNYNNIDDILDPYDNVVILYEMKDGYGHWVCLIRHKKMNKIEFFDPYGLCIDDQLSYISKEYRKKSGQEFPILSLLLLNSPYKIVYNSKQLQKYSNDVSSCGRHVCIRIILKDIPLNEYSKLLRENKYDPDMTVTYLTAFIK